MKLHNVKKAFTLIELLVVITIMGILATGAVGIYTSQIKKSRDSTRISDIKVLEQAVMQFYQDESVFPNKYSDWIGNDTGSVSIKKDYIQILPGDPKTGEVCLGSGTTTVCDYVYNVGKDKNEINNGAYKLSIGFEDIGNLNVRAGNGYDGGTDGSRYEVWSGDENLDIGEVDHQTKTRFTSSPAETSIASAKGITILRGGIGAN